ncbi:MAG: LuxR C-terminal-related transcriptional regulator [Acidobacteriota bacterium]
MNTGEAITAGRDAFRRRAWSECCRLMGAADREAPLEPEDLEILATAGYLVGQDEESESYRARAHQLFLTRGDCEGAARAAFWLAFGLLQRGASGPGSGWITRAQRLLDEAGLDCPVRGYVLIPQAIRLVMQGDPSGAHDTFHAAADIANRFDDPDLAALSCQGLGRALIRLGKVTEGVALLDEAMVSVVAGDVSPILAGDIYCSVLEACHEIFDLRRGYEWTMSLAQWCAGQADLVRYRGECLLYRGEILQSRGAWREAEQDAVHARELLTSPHRRPAAGAASYRLGELYRLRGELAKAEAAYREANEWGKNPQPGLSLLRLAQGQIDVAAASIRSTLTEARLGSARVPLLRAAVEILVAAGDLDGARTFARQLSESASTLGAPLLTAASAQANGLICLASGELPAALTALREACEHWRELEIPYEEAHARVLIAAVKRRIGDHDGASIDLDAARRTFARLGSLPALRRVEALLERPSRRVGPLSEREMQVLRQVAAGKTNRAIAEALFISEKTVARHVSNIFDKLGVSSRAAATAWAYERNLI